MNKSLKNYEEQGSKAFISDEEFLAGAPKRKRKSIIAWSILLSLIAIFVILIIIALASSSPDTSTAGNTNTSSQGSDVQNAKQRMDSLRNQYDACSSNLEARRGSVDAYDDYEVNSFNSSVEDCENTRLQLNSAVDNYNKLAGFE